MTSRPQRPQHEQDLIDLTKDLLDTSILGIKNLDKKGVSMIKPNAAYELFANTIVTSIIYLEASGEYIIHDRNKSNG